MRRCNNCGQELIEIDNKGRHLTGCLTCNLWAGEGEGWITPPLGRRMGLMAIFTRPPKRL
jgi:hypothetical protein